MLRARDQPLSGVGAEVCSVYTYGHGLEDAEGVSLMTIAWERELTCKSPESILPKYWYFARLTRDYERNY